MKISLDRIAMRNFGEKDTIEIVEKRKRPRNPGKMKKFLKKGLILWTNPVIMGNCLKLVLGIGGVTNA